MNKLPKKNAIKVAMGNFSQFVQNPKLKEAVVAKKSNGEPLFYTGGYNMVFQLELDNKTWAYRIWFAPMGDMKYRYENTASFLTKNNIPFFTQFLYEEAAILIPGTISDVVRMEWVEGRLLKEYLEEIILDKAALKKLARNFLDIAKTMHQKKISHGDLQEKNIIVSDNGELTLIDYDSICIPAFEGDDQFIVGQEGYQHPSRFTGGIATLKADYFSELILFLSIEALAENPDLWHSYKLADTNHLLFSKEDFNDLENTEIYRELSALNVPLIDALLDILQSYLATESYLDLAPFYTQLDPQLMDASPQKEAEVDQESTNQWNNLINDLMIKIELEQDQAAIKKIFALAEDELDLARYEAGKLLYRGKYVARDLQGAIEWLKKGQANKHLPSIVQLGKIYLHETDLELAEKGFDLLSKGAMYENQEAILATAECLWYGIGTKVDRHKAKERFQLAVRKKTKHAWQKLLLALSHEHLANYILVIYANDFSEGFNQDVYQECKSIYKQDLRVPVAIIDHHSLSGVPKERGIVITADGILWNIRKEDSPKMIKWADIKPESIRRKNNRIILNDQEEPTYFPAVGVRDELYQGLEKLIHEVLDNQKLKN